MRVACVQWPNGLIPDTVLWSALADDIAAARPHVLITNEMPFGTWLAAYPHFDAEHAAQSVRLHDAGLQALQALKLPIVISSRPILADTRLANEAFLLEHGCFRSLHQKQFFPAEKGWFETGWFEAAMLGFQVAEADGLRVGALICSELMFNEKARAYGQAGAHLIAVPRATGCSQRIWKTAGAMAAIVSGCYVASSNRTGSNPDGPIFGGGGHAFAPDGSLLCETLEDTTVAVFDLDLSLAEAQKSQYPVYVSKLQAP